MDTCIPSSPVAARRSSLRRALPVLAGGLVLGAIAWLVISRRDEFVAAMGLAPLWLLAVAAVLQVVALVARSEAWLSSVSAAGGLVSRRCLFRASSAGVAGGLLNGQLGLAARIAALRRIDPERSPCIAGMIGAEFPIIAVEILFGVVMSFTLIGPLGLPWWSVPAALAVVLTVGAVFRSRVPPHGREIWRGLDALRTSRSAGRVGGFVMLAIAAQVTRNWLVLNALGVDASILDAVAVLIAISTLMQLPIGPGVGAAAAVLILGPQGVAVVAASGVLLTATGTIGSLAFASWGLVDHLSTGRRIPVRGAWRSVTANLAALTPARRRAVEAPSSAG